MHATEKARRTILRVHLPVTLASLRQQILLADAYGGYNGVVAGNGITRAGCWSHARRKFVEAEKSAPELAREAATLMDAPSALERQAKDVSVAERLELRRKKSVSILAQLHRKLLIWKERCYQSEV